MKNSKLIIISLMTASLSITFNSCKKADTPESTASSIISGGSGYLSGTFISNEGAFGAGNGSISFYSPGSDQVFNEVFMLENNRPLGDIVQSISKIGSSAYICVNASNKVEVANAITLKEEATITGITQPRYMVANNTTGYVSSWGNGGEIAIIDLISNSVSGTIAVGSGPEKMAINNNNLYVANSGGYGLDSTISVIDLTTNSVTATITIDAYNPSAIVNGNGNTIWVLAKGRTIYDASWNIIGHDPSKLIEINTSTNSIVSTTTLFATEHPANVDISPDLSTLYFGGSYGFTGIYTVNTMAPSAPSLFINEDNYGFFINQANGNIFILQHASSANGALLRYNAGGTKLGEYTVGIFPSNGARKAG